MSPLPVAAALGLLLLAVGWAACLAIAAALAVAGLLRATVTTLAAVARRLPRRAHR